ncbi:hypothetical protein FQN60_006294 [Etheostoma spectabile]|uniref:G-protein coupled receptors family 1 profile domain-containing protein n=1 Tax=Etheostoma spectabile TaxID=54343 RepID=A0A5J5CP65_9PERO|nr:hypothetical protein FQN60_006294 [Etheostoma spectabile]
MASNITTTTTTSQPSSISIGAQKRSVTCLLVLNVAMADAFVLLSAPFFLRYLAGGRGWEFGSAACKLVHYLSSVNMYVSIYLICLMSIDRWLAVSRPFLSQRMRTKRSLLILLLVVWVLAFILSVPMPFYRSNLSPPNNTLKYCVPYHWQSKGHRVFQYLSETIMGCLLPFSLIITCYSSVICRLKSAMFQHRGQGSRLILLIISAFAVSHIRQAGFSFMGKLFETTNSESRSMSTRSGRMSRSSSSPDESSVLHTLSIKLGNPFKDKNKPRSSSVAGKEVDQPVLKVLTSVEMIE